MPYRYRRICPLCGRPELLKLSNHLQQVHGIVERQEWLKRAVFTPLYNPFVSQEFTEALKPVKKRKQKPSIKPRTKSTSTMLEEPYRDFRFRHKFSLLVVGPSQSGKTVLVQQILEHDHIQYENPSLPRHIYWFYGQEQNLYSEMKRKLGTSITFRKGLPDFKDDLCDLDRRFNNICVLDDLMDLAVDSSIISKLFTQGRHRNASVILMLQNAFPKGKHNTSIARNAQYIALFRCPADRRQIGMIADRIFDKTKPVFMELYHKVTLLPYSYVLIDNKPDTESDKQVIVDVFGNCRYFSGINGEKHKENLTEETKKNTVVSTENGQVLTPTKDILKMRYPNGPLVLNLTNSDFDTICDNFRGCPMSYNPDPQWTLWRVIELEDDRPYGLVGYYPCVLKDIQDNVTYWNLSIDYVYYEADRRLKPYLNYKKKL